jgi:hypothetical protein
MSIDHNLVIQTDFNNQTAFSIELKKIINDFLNQKKPIIPMIHKIEIKTFEDHDFQEMDFFELHFNYTKDGVKGKYRITVCFGCDSDYDDYGLSGKKIILIMNNWGNSTEIIEYIGTKLHSFGKIHIRHDDCKDSFELFTNGINLLKRYRDTFVS